MKDSTTYHYFRYEPIKWHVLETDGDTAMLLSDVGLDCQEYNKSSSEVVEYSTWEKSTIRSWLNGYGAKSNQTYIDYGSRNFIDSAFNGQEKESIADTEVVIVVVLIMIVFIV